MPALDDLLIVPVEEGEQQGADVGAVDVGVAHEDDGVVAQLREVLVLLAHARTEGGDEHLDLLRGEHLVEAGLLDVEYLATQRQDRLIAAGAGPPPGGPPPGGPPRGQLRPRRSAPPARGGPGPG